MRLGQYVGHLMSARANNKKRALDLVAQRNGKATLSLTFLVLKGFWSRALSFIHRILKIRDIAGGTVKAAAILFQTRRDPDAVHTLPYSDSHIYFRGIDLQALIEVLVNTEYAFLKDVTLSRPTPVILDIGAHIGTFAIWALGVNHGARILSVEADPETYGVLTRNADVVVESGKDWTVINRAAGRIDDEVLTFSNAGPSMSHRVDPDGTLTVSSISLGTLIDRIAGQGGQVDLVKVDIEGAEEAFLAESADALTKVEVAVVELHPGHCDTERVISVLRSQFDRIEEISGRLSSKPLLYCRKTAAA